MVNWSDNRVLVTGGSGFMGQALVRSLLERDVGAVCVYSRGEYAQATMRQALHDPGSRVRWFIGDVRDRERLRQAMRGVDVVLHTAALKRVEVGEYNPSEMVATNVIGAMNVVQEAMDAGVGMVVATSTDKACQPLNMYGATKLCMEKLLLGANTAAGAHSTRFSVVRYGNVAGSTGSVIPTWRQMAAAGQKVVPMRDPQCARFWMTIDEAVRLVLWTAENMEGGELVVPLMPAYRLPDLAAAMGLETVDASLGQGEKLNETMIAPGEHQDFRYHEPYLVSGGLARRYQEPNIAGVRTHMLSIDELRERLKAVP